MPFDDICEDNCWQTWTSQTIKRSYAELELMTVAYERRDFALVSKSWATGIFPCNQVCAINRAGSPLEVFLVLWNAGRVAMVWPVARHADHIEVASAGDPEVQFKIIIDVHDAYIIPTGGASPLRSLIVRKEKPDVPIGVQLLILGKAVPLLTWHEQRGYANLSEAFLEKLCIEKKAKALPTLPEQAEPSDQYACRLLLHTKPGLLHDELLALLSSRHALEDAALADQETIDQQILDDVMQPSDRKEALQCQHENKEQKAKVASKQRSMPAFVKALGLSKPKALPKNTYAEKIKGYNKKAPSFRWYNELAPSNTEIYDLKPPDAAVLADMTSGCYRVHHKSLPGSRKCFSWTKRGVPKAVAAALSQMWAWDAELTGQPCPLPAELFAELE